MRITTRCGPERAPVLRTFADLPLLRLRRTARRDKETDRVRTACFHFVHARAPLRILQGSEPAAFRPASTLLVSRTESSARDVVLDETGGGRVVVDNLRGVVELAENALGEDLAELRASKRPSQ